MSLSLYQLKPAFQRLLQPLIAGCIACKITPNQLTASALLISALAGLLLLTAPPSIVLWAYPLLMLLRMALNALDGMLARQTDQQSNFGALFNEIADVVADLLMYLPWLCLLPEQTIAVVLFSVGAVLVEFAGVLALSIQAPRRFDGPFGKSDRALFAALWVIAWAMQAPTQWLVLSLYLASGLLVITLSNRLRQAYRSSGN